jgi:transposase
MRLRDDESSFSITDMKRYGYTVKGQEISNVIRHKHNKQTLTAITAISINGIVAKEIVQGSVNGNVYRDYLAKNINIFRNKVVVNDNARAHHARVVKQFTQEQNINLKFNPAYSPEFNPIELSFNKIKCEFRKKDHKDLKKDIEEAFEKITSTDCVGFYKKTYNFMQKYV